MTARTNVTRLTCTTAMLLPFLLTTNVESGNAESRALTIVGPPTVNSAVSRAFTIALGAQNNSAVSRTVTVKYCVGDVDNSFTVGVSDLLTLLADWGTPGVCTDFDNSGEVNVTDLLILLAGWGKCP